MASINTIVKRKQYLWLGIVVEQTAALWIAPYIDNQDVYHQPSSVFFVIKPSAWGKPRIN